MSQLLPGTEVVARELRWEVVFAQSAGKQTLYRLRCLEGGLRGQEFDLLEPFEEIKPVIHELQPEKAARLQLWRVYHQAFLMEQAFGSHALLVAQPGRLRIAPYQLVPVMRVLQMSRPRLLLADGVGLGKTIQAGLILSELIARRRAHRILIVSPAGPLLLQWEREMRERFGLRFTTLDREKLQEIRYANELGSNPFDYEGLGLISIDFAKQEKILRDLERSQYDVVVIDEAHHCASLSQAGTREDSLRRRLAEVLARQADGLLLLTATPHDGYDPHFASIMELLDPSLVNGRGALRGHAYQKHIVRRLKRHILDHETGQPLFTERQVFPQQVTFQKQDHPSYSAFQEALLSLVAPRLKRALRQRHYGEVLAFISLLKRSVSTAFACQKTLQVIADRLTKLAEAGQEEQDARKQRLRSLAEYRRRLDRFGVLSFEEEQEQADMEAEDMAADLFSGGVDEFIATIERLRKDSRRQREHLKQSKDTRDGLLALVELAKEAAKEDPKLVALFDVIQSIRQKHPHANILVYTEYSDSQDVVIEYLQQAIQQKTLRGEVLAISGHDPEERRSLLSARFVEEDNLILVSTDATAEGLNLHARCYHLIHLELPYNPNRLEQRNGRIDRFGQRHSPQVYYLYLTGTFEENLLLKLVAKYEKQRSRLQFVPNTLGFMGNEESMGIVKLLEGLADSNQLPLFGQPSPLKTLEQAASEDTQTPAYQDLLAEVDMAFRKFEKTTELYQWLGDKGLGADQEQLSQAHQAYSLGQNLGVVDLLGFVKDAIRSESSDPHSVRQIDGDLWELRLSSSWTYGLEQLPGYDENTRILRLTTDPKRTHDAHGHSVGYLGRAHPIVRRALDRVRHVQFGADHHLIDRRVSAARYEGKEPALLFTYLGRLDSTKGREFERVVAVQVSQYGTPQPIRHYTDWASLAELSRAISPDGVWEKIFASWGMHKLADAQYAAHQCFVEQTQSFQEEYSQRIERERKDLYNWLEARVSDICGSLPIHTYQQEDLFSENRPSDRPSALDVFPKNSHHLDNPLARLEAFLHDQNHIQSTIIEAEGVLRLYRHRAKDLEQRATLEPLDISLLGMLMLVPQA